MPIEGLWIVKFTAAQLSGSGVLVLSQGKVFGGETGFYYIGTYVADGNVVKARVMIRNFDPSVPSGFGIPGDYEMDVSATMQDSTMSGTAIISGQPQYSLGLKLIKTANL